MATDFLGKIIARKREDIAAAAERVPEEVLAGRCLDAPPKRPFTQKLATPGPHGINILAEIKRASPSKGAIRMDLDPAAYARAYEEGGAAAISVLTDEPFFKGSLEDLANARRATTLPVLRKDFIISPYQVFESKAAGADAILLIVRILSKEEIRNLFDLAGELDLDVLVEIHSRNELETATEIGASLIGINNRNLATFETNIKRAMEMAADLKPDQVAVAASGISSRGDIEEYANSPVKTFLIGESIVRSTDPTGFIRSLLGVP
jgi:indole-3-glycerol phosphate synthase